MIHVPSNFFVVLTPSPRSTAHLPLAHQRSVAPQKTTQESRIKLLHFYLCVTPCVFKCFFSGDESLVCFDPAIISAVKTTKPDPAPSPERWNQRREAEEEGARESL